MPGILSRLHLLKSKIKGNFSGDANFLHWFYIKLQIEIIKRHWCGTTVVSRLREFNQTDMPNLINTI